MLSESKEKAPEHECFAKRMEGLRLEIEHDESTFSNHEVNTYRAFDELIFFIRKTTGYDPSWIEEAYQKHCTTKGRPVKYTRAILEAKCAFIYLLEQRGSSKIQAIKLLMRITGDVAMSEGQSKALQGAYRDFVVSEHFINNEDEDFLNLSIFLPQLLEFNIEHLTSSEAASEKAVEAFTVLLKDISDCMRESHSIIKKYDRDYPAIYGEKFLTWTNEIPTNITDHFYSPQNSLMLKTSNRAFREYLSTITYARKREFNRDRLNGR